jgi:lipid II isoglutaminyl synthase (glutamine-hydrolysing)
MRLRKNLMILIPARIIGRLVYNLSRCFSLGEGSNIPGKIAMRIFPNILTLQVPRFKKGWIIITGTNGKTTTTKVLVELMRETGYQVCTNSQGANLLTGIVTSLLLADARPTEEYIADYAVFEIDEAVLIRAFETFQPQILVVTNFSRDQLDRYGEVDSNVTRIMELVRNTGDHCKVILNGNDPNIARIGSVVKPENRFYFGIKQTNDGIETGLLIERDTATGLEKLELPTLDLWAEAIQTEYLSGSHFTMGYDNGLTNIALELPGVFNILNALAAVSVCLTIGINLDKIKMVLSKIQSSYGRSEHFQYQGSSIYMFLVKNPVGFNHIIQLLNQAHGPKRVLLLLNDLTADGTDVSWIWDVAMENLWKVKGIKEIVTSGTRAGDMALRVKYADPPDLPLSVDYQPKRAFKELTQRLKDDEELLILANYTAMIGFRPYLLKVSSRKEN